MNLKIGLLCSCVFLHFYQLPGYKTEIDKINDLKVCNDANMLINLI